MPVLKKGCCCAELETCAAILGWIGVIFSIFNIFGPFAMGYHWLDIIVYIIMGITHLIVSALLIKATKDRKANLVVPWLVVVVLELIIMIILQVVGLIAVAPPTEIVAGSVIGMFIGVAISIYFWMCVYSYYQQLTSQ